MAGSYSLLHSPVAGDPTVISLAQISATTVRVVWSQPLGGAPETGYVVHYSDGTNDRSNSVHVAASSTSSDITDLTSGLSYTISVEATSDHLSGESDDIALTMSEYSLTSTFVHYHVRNALYITFSTVSPLEAPHGVVVSDVGSTSVRVSWQAVEGAERYTVAFTQTVGDEQRGLCHSTTHTASVSVDITSVSVAVGQGGNANMLSAYTAYSITVVAESDDQFNSGDSEPVTVTTAQTSMYGHK